MSLTYAQFSLKVLRLISDPNFEIYSEETIHDAVCSAHDAILPWMPCYGELELTAGSDGANFALPENIYDLQAVQDVSTGKFIYKATIAAGTVRGNTQADNDWIESPKGNLSLSIPITETYKLKLYYLSYWPKPPLPSSSSFVITVPPVAHQGMIYYAASVALTSVIVDTATLGPFKSRVDSGTPQHNPMKDVSDWFRALWLQEMKLMPPYQKAKA